ncbi:MAG: SDR family NAD(P)-dependent oxidoreductase [Muribaculaceae bacterium]|nr:SDR family NAD(P)-dependent oxidoreductase [Muribaculaceae bacterium]MDE5595494.1 SDR family NAD(P)-dependent oxidoreductase [Muribaculaceae bacterium]
MKKIIIIGASSGMGMRVATDFARAGWRVGIAARNEERLRAVKEIFPERIEYSVIDVTAPDAVKKFEDLIETLDGMDILLYAAGTGWYNPELNLGKDEATIGVNVTGFTKIINAAYRYFKATANVSKGRIAAITSVAGMKGLGVSAAYSASKRYQWTYLQALDQLAHSQHVNVSITDIRPGFVDTPLLAGNRNYPMLMSVDYVAPRIEKAIMERRRVATIDSRWAIVSGLWSAIPDCLWRHLQLKM